MQRDCPRGGKCGGSSNCKFSVECSGENRAGGDAIGDPFVTGDPLVVTQEELKRVRAAMEATAWVAQATIEERETSHGSYYHQARTAQELKKLIHDHSHGWASLSVEQRESLDMIAVKISRILNGNPNEPDHWRDLAGYATLVANTLETGDHLGRIQTKQPSA